MKKMTTKEILVAARKKYEENPSHAPRGQLNPGRSECVLSAIDRIAFRFTLNTDVLTAYSLVCRAAGVTSESELMNYNATHTTEEVLTNVPDKAIEAA